MIENDCLVVRKVLTTKLWFFAILRNNATYGFNDDTYGYQWTNASTAYKMDWNIKTWHIKIMVNLSGQIDELVEGKPGEEWENIA